MVDALDPYDLTAIEARVLGVLIEKQLTTPDAYPLTLNALTTGCNQTSNRDPVVHYEPYQVETTALVLKSKGLVRVVHPGSGERATKYRQVADEALDLTPAERAVVGALLVRRGPQTLSELKTRTERLHPFSSVAEVEATLDALSRARHPAGRSRGTPAGPEGGALAPAPRGRRRRKGGHDRADDDQPRHPRRQPGGRAGGADRRARGSRRRARRSPR